MIDKLDINKNDIFYDLGSGTGKVPLQFYTNSKVKKAVGIEIQPHRHEIAVNITKNILIPNKKLEYINENLINSNISDATIVFLCSTCYSTELLDIIYVLKQIIISLKNYPKFNQLLPNSDTLQVKCSWTKSTNCYIYKI